MDRISSPEQLNKLMKVSKSRIWVILILLLLLVGCGYYWFFNNEVVITEKYPCYISAEEVPLEDYVYEILLQSSGSEEFAQGNLEGTIEDFGAEYMKQTVRPALLYLEDLAKTEMNGLETVEVAGFRGGVVNIPDGAFDCSRIVKDAQFTEQEMRQVGMNPGIRYYPVLVAVKEPRGSRDPAPGLYTATVIIDVLKPSSMILK